MFAERLKSLRKERGLTQRDVFSALGLSERNHQSFEYGAIKPSYDTLVALADFFSVTTDYLTGRSKNPKAYYVEFDELEERTDLPGDTLVETSVMVGGTESQIKLLMEYMDAREIGYDRAAVLEALDSARKANP